MEKIPFNKPFLTGQELEYIQRAVESGKISGNGLFTQKCHEFFRSRFNEAMVLLTSSCTDALEMASILAEIEPGDEVILPSYTFVSTANAFALRGADLVFVDSEAQTPNMDCSLLESLITPRTKAIVPVHYAGVACDMDKVLQIAKQNSLTIIEDAAQAVDSFYKGRPLGTFGDLAAFSFHETKNVICGEGGMLVVNRANLAQRAEIVWEKGTNRSAFWRGEVDKYNWIDLGSSFLPSEITAAFLFAQLEWLEKIQNKRKLLWSRYYDGLRALGAAEKFRLPFIPDYASNNAHMFYLVCRSLSERIGLLDHLKSQGIYAVSHYISLHSSPFQSSSLQAKRQLPWSDHYTNCLIRLPLYFELTEEQVDMICKEIHLFYSRI